MSFTESEVEECVLLQHRIMQLINKHSNDVGFSVIMTILLKSVANEHNKKEDFMDAVSISWDRHMGNVE
jgi:hypothetical protein